MSESIYLSRLMVACMSPSRSASYLHPLTAEAQVVTSWAFGSRRLDRDTASNHEHRKAWTRPERAISLQAIPAIHTSLDCVTACCDHKSSLSCPPPKMLPNQRHQIWWTGCPTRGNARCRSKHPLCSWWQYRSTATGSSHLSGCYIRMKKTAMSCKARCYSNFMSS